MDYLKLANQVCFPLYALSRVLTAHYKPILDDIGLTYPQYLVMLVLWEHQECSVKEIGEKLLLDSGTLTPMLKKLEAKKLVRRIRSRSDERIMMISLTETGAALKAQASTVPESFKCSLGLSLEEMLNLKASINPILEKTKQNNKTL